MKALFSRSASDVHNNSNKAIIGGTNGIAKTGFFIVAASVLLVFQMRVNASLTNYYRGGPVFAEPVAGCDCHVLPTNSTSQHWESSHRLCTGVHDRSGGFVALVDSEANKVPRLIKPSSRKDSRTAVICAMMKEEEAIVDEWVDYNLGIGFSHIHIHDNTELFELEQWALERQEIFNDSISIQHDSRKGAQRLAYRECAEKMFNLGHDWAFFADVDEFLVIKNRTKYPHVVDMLVDQVPSGAIAINWRVFGKSYRKTFEPIPVTKRFQFRTKDEYVMNKQVKSIVHLGSFNFSVTRLKTPHYYPLKKAKGIRYKNLDNSIGVIHHYRFKSYMEYIRKRLKGDVLFAKLRAVPEAKEGKTHKKDYVPNGTIFDDQAWQILKEVAPRYRFYDDFYEIPLHTPDPNEI